MANEIGDIRVNATDYDGAIVIEHFCYANTPEPIWCVPAWEEMGEAQFVGPFASVEDAQVSLSAELSA